MKNILILTFFLFGALSSFAQDILIKKNGDELPVKILELTPDMIKYKRFDNLDGPNISIWKTDVFMIKYQNGTKEVITAAPKPITPPQTKTPAYSNPAFEEPAPYVMKLNGPRIGLTFIAPGELADRLEDNWSANPVITQFGWQFETQIFNSDNGVSGLVEFVPLIGGLEQGLFLPSATGLIGLRGKSGLEIGLGPNVSLAGVGLAFAAGTSFTSGNMHFPLNFAVVPSKEGTRYSILVGFNYRRQ